MPKNRNMPAVSAARPQVSGLSWEVRPQALQAWNPGLRAASQDSEASIGIYDVIGDYWGEGVTAKRIAAALRSIGSDKDVTVYVNSPGGDLFEGFAIYNLLREHKGRVTVKVIGLAASAASYIAMAGDVVEIARAGFLMIHNTWVVAIGNRNDLEGIAEQLKPFDAAMADIYSVHTGISTEQIVEMMDAETWIGGAEAVDQGFADQLLAADEVDERDEDDKSRRAAHQIDTILARAGVARTERRRLFQEFKSSTPSAAGGTTPVAGATGTPSAADAELLAAIREFTAYLNSLSKGLNHE
jgi:ATP-dependent Clp protease, protease subunit